MKNYEKWNAPKETIENLTNGLAYIKQVSVDKYSCVYVAMQVMNILNGMIARGEIAWNIPFTVKIPHFLTYFKNMPRMKKAGNVLYDKITRERLTIMQSELIGLDMYFKDFWRRLGKVNILLVIKEDGEDVVLEDIENIFKKYDSEELINRACLKIDFKPRTMPEHRIKTQC